MSVFTAAPYSLSIDNVIKGKVSATNNKGTSALSTLNSTGALVQKVPQIAPTIQSGSLTSMNQIQLEWFNLTLNSQNGGSPIIEYKIFWDNGVGNDVFSELVTITNLTTLKYTKTGVVEGLVYQFKIQAKNIYGYGPLSTSPQSITPASIPYQPYNLQLVSADTT